MSVEAERELEAVALGFDSAQDKADYECKLLGDSGDIQARLRDPQYLGFDETNANLNEASRTISSLLGIAHSQERMLAETRNQLEVQKTIVGAQAMLIDQERENLKEQLKNAFVAGCCAVLTWTKSGMPQDDLDEAGYDYAAHILAPEGWDL